VSLTDREGVREQYRESANLDARVQLHERFSVNRTGWHPWVFDQLGLTAQQRIIEIGCGSGHLWRSNDGRVPENLTITLSDLSEGMLAEARRQLHGDDRFRFVVADVQQLPFEQTAFDVVIANHMLYHVPNREGALAEVRRLLPPGGRFYAATNGRGHLQELGELVARFAPDVAAWVAGHADAIAFTLENGADQIRRHFSHVELRRYEDALVVTEAQPLLAYILSGASRSALEGERLAALAAFIEREIATQGAIRIGKDSGLFVAW
jgi:ubiquinone/menaquinone biosynthesis C-methylase UbiE